MSRHLITCFNICPLISPVNLHSPLITIIPFIVEVLVLLGISTDTLNCVTKVSVTISNTTREPREVFLCFHKHLEIVYIFFHVLYMKPEIKRFG